MVIGTSWQRLLAFADALHVVLELILKILRSHSSPLHHHRRVVVVGDSRDELRGGIGSGPGGGMQRRRPWLR